MRHRAAAEQYEFRGYSIPLDLLVLTGGGPDTFDEIVDAHVRQLEAHAPIRPHDHVVEIGCGIGRDAIPLTEIVRPPGSYVGVDIISSSVEWCTANITARHPHFRFAFFDVHDELHNPTGTLATTDVRIPVDDSSIDRVLGQSVFTHLFEDEIVHYLCEFRRVLNPKGTAMMSFFVTDDEILTEPVRPLAAIEISAPWAPACYVHDPAHPRGAVAFTHTAVADMARRAGLGISDVHVGNWSGHHHNDLDGQDVVVFTVETGRAQGPIAHAAPYAARMALDDELVNRVTWKIPNALALVGSRAGDERNAMTTSWITQLSMDPVLIGIGVDNTAVTHRLITDGGCFTVNLWDADDTRVFVKFSKPATFEDETLNGRAVREATTGAPVFEEAIAWLDCEVRHSLDLGTHTLFVGELVDAGIVDDETRAASMSDTRMKYGGVKRH